MTKQEFLNLENDQWFTYKGNDYKLLIWDDIESKSVTMGNWGKLMNIDKVTDKYVNLFTFDMMAQRSNYKMALSEITLKS